MGKEKKLPKAGSSKMAIDKKKSKKNKKKCKKIISRYIS
jgi:hypothetical protein